MATFTVEANGLMTDDAAFAGSGVPGVSDSTVNTAFVLRVAANHATDGAGGHAVSGTGVMEVDGGITLGAGGAALALTQTATLRHSGIGAGAALVSQLAGQIVTAQGTDAANRVSILGVDATQHIRFSQGHTNAGVGRIQLNLCQLEFVGDASNPLVQSNLSGAGHTAFITNSILENCGRWNLYTTGLSATAIFRFNSNNCTGVAGTSFVRVSADPSAITTGVREIIGNYSDKPLDTFGAINFRGFTISGNVTLGTYNLYGANQPALFSENLIIKDTQAPHNLASSPLNNFFIQDGSVSNPHFVTDGGGISGTFVHDGNIFETLGSVSNGDGILIYPGTGTRTTTILRSLVLPNGVGAISCTVVSALGTVNTTWSADHCTFLTGAPSSASGIVGGETEPGFAGMCTSARSHIGWTNGVDGALLNTGGSPVDGYFAVAGFSCGWNLTGDVAFTDNWQPADVKFGVAPGGDDVNRNPLFVDNTRNLRTFGASLGGAGTNADTLAELAKMNLSTWNPAYTPAACITWIKGGFYVQEPDLENAGHDGVTIGAMPFLAAGGGGVIDLSRGARRGALRGAYRGGQ